ncbi:MAG: type II toxin-antitoxin system RelE/ParE family toxin [Clostridia bacterium]|nr:type II toxin-antitoxin system RelE/ParE family toxin [Clostridia bacterium]
MACKYTFRFTESALADLDDAVAYIAEELANPKAAATLMSGVQKAVDEACRFPESGELVDNAYLPNPSIRKKLVGNYILYYLPDEADKTVVVVRFLYGRRNTEAALKDLS